MTTLVKVGWLLYEAVVAIFAHRQRRIKLSFIHFRLKFEEPKSKNFLLFRTKSPVGGATVELKRFSTVVVVKSDC